MLELHLLNRIVYFEQRPEKLLRYVLASFEVEDQAFEEIESAPEQYTTREMSVELDGLVVVQCMIN